MIVNGVEPRGSSLGFGSSAMVQNARRRGAKERARLGLTSGEKSHGVSSVRNKGSLPRRG